MRAWKYLISIPCIFFLLSGCEEDTLQPSELLGKWKWVRSAGAGGITGKYTVTTPEDVGYDQFMEFGSSDTILHFRNDTLKEYSILHSMRLYSDRIEAEQSFYVSIETAKGVEETVGWTESVLLKGDTLYTTHNESFGTWGDWYVRSGPR